jgi:hypothetical protein
MENKMNNEIVKCEYGSCENEATTISWKQPARYPNPNGTGEIVPNKILINTCYPCDLWIDLREYGTD